jgi:archaellum component FlaC
MSVGTMCEPVETLKNAKAELQLIASRTEIQVKSMALAFREFAGQADTILGLAAAIIDCVENESVSSILPKVKILGAEAKQLIGERVHATAGILEAVGTEVKLLRQLSQVAVQQTEIALKTKSLSVLTNVQVAHLGAEGTGFQYLAHELADFSRSLIEDAQALESRMGARQTAIQETKRVLSTELPHLREKLALIEEGLENDLAALDSSLAQVSRTPAQFKAGVEDIAKEIAGVVSAIQAHDITRQQSEHVEEAFAVISMRMPGVADSVTGNSQDFSPAYAGLTIQIYQLKSIQSTVENWTSQIKRCMSGILRVSASELAGIGPMVLGNEREVSSQLAHIELLERKSQAYNARIQQTLEGLSSLLQFVGEHAQRSQSIRNRLRLLSFNSIIEAKHLGSKAEAVLAIARTINEISSDWTDIADRYSRAMEEMEVLMKNANTTMEAFSEASNEKLSDAQAQTRIGLENLRTAAAFAATQTAKMDAITAQMQAKSAEVAGTDELLDASAGQIEAILLQLEFLRHELEINHPEAKCLRDEADVERLFSADYTTEMEREVLHAALRGAALPVAKPTLEGNDVELF